jgi:hypothetical protein
MGRPRIHASDTERRRAQNERRKESRRLQPSHKLPVFLGIDGEGSGRGAEHAYVLLGAGDSAVSDVSGLGFGAIAGFLYSQFRSRPNAVWCGFFLGYDFTQWLKLLPEHKARRLFKPELRARRPVLNTDTGELESDPRGPFPVTWEGWEFDLLGMKRFKLRPEAGGAWMYINDAGPFFQASLLSVIDPAKWDVPVVTEAEYELVKRGKDNRDSAILDHDMVRYNALENEILSRLMDRLARGFAKAGVFLDKDQWFGPGQAASAWMAKAGVPDREMVHQAVTRNRPVRNPLDLGRLSYYGGWFEIFAHGLIPGTSWEYDINSAYPHIISRLPCLLHGSWFVDNTGISDPRPDSYRLVHASVLGRDPVCGAMLYRDKDHRISRPASSSGWYWEHELAAGMRAGVIYQVNIKEGVRYDPCGCRPPLRGVAGLYAERLRVGKDTPEGKTLKLLYNSIYGKFAQSIGEPRYGNALYASLITAGCRTLILDAIATHPEGTNALLMVATDGIYFRSRHPALPVSADLGSWSESAKENLLLFKPGVYWDDNTRERIRDGRDPHFKARGISAKAFAESLAAIDAAFARWDGVHRSSSGLPGRVWPAVKFTSSFSMVTCQQAIQRGRWDTAGSVDSIELVQDSDPSGKRGGLVNAGGIWRSFPHPGGEESVPYDKAFGQPDPDEYGITDDGTVRDSWKLR